MFESLWNLFQPAPAPVQSKPAPKVDAQDALRRATRAYQRKLYDPLESRGRGPLATCPLTGSRLKNPVIAPNGESYEGAAVRRYVAKHGLIPGTTIPCTEAQLRPNLGLTKLLRHAHRKGLRDAMMDGVGTSPMVSPFVASDGQTYDRSSLLHLNRFSDRTSPATKTALDDVAYFDKALARIGQRFAMRMACPRGPVLRIPDKDAVDWDRGEILAERPDVATPKLRKSMSQASKAGAAAGSLTGAAIGGALFGIGALVGIPVGAAAGAILGAMGSAARYAYSKLNRRFRRHQAEKHGADIDGVANRIERLDATAHMQRGRRATTKWSASNRHTCPLTGKPFHDPVIAPDGYVYERKALVQELKKHDGRIGGTGMKMAVSELYRDQATRDAMDSDDASDTASRHLDPITMEPLKFPVVASDGRTYEDTTFVELFRKHNGISPFTRQKLRPEAYRHRRLETEARKRDGDPWRTSPDRTVVYGNAHYRMDHAGKPVVHPEGDDILQEIADEILRDEAIDIGDAIRRGWTMGQDHAADARVASELGVRPRPRRRARPKKAEPKGPSWTETVSAAMGSAASAVSNAFSSAGDTTSKWWKQLTTPPPRPRRRVRSRRREEDSGPDLHRMSRSEVLRYAERLARKAERRNQRERERRRQMRRNADEITRLTNAFFGR